MPRAIVLVTCTFVLGIIAADRLFYENLHVPAWLSVAMWGLCLLLATMAWLCRKGDRYTLRQRLLFPLVIGLFFAVAGFTRYASYAQTVQQSWQQMKHPHVNRGNPDEFDYVRWRWIQGVEDSTSWKSRIQAKALNIRSRLLANYATTGLDEETFGIVSAATLGDRSHLSRETRDLYAAAGASHLLALSGLHLGILVGFLLTLLNSRFLLSRWRPWLGVAIILFIWCYAFIAGLPSSLVRASLMTSIIVIGALHQRYGHPLHWLTLTALFMLAIRPVYLFDVGAQLSFAAVFGIVTLHRRWYSTLFQRWRLVSFKLERYHLMWPLTAFSVSLAAQITTLPLVAFYFHRIPTYAPFFNILFVPLTTVLIYGAMLLLLLSLLFSALSWGAAVLTFMGRCLSWLVTAQLALMQFEVRLPAAVINDFWSMKAEPQVVVYNNYRCPALHIVASHERSWLLMPEPDSLATGMHYIAESFWRRRLTAEPILLKDRKVIALQGDTIDKRSYNASANGKSNNATGRGRFSAVMIDTPTLPVPAHTSSQLPSAPIGIDILWITKGYKGDRLKELSRLYRPHLLVLDASLKKWQRTGLANEAAGLGWYVYDVSSQGALRIRL